MEKTYSQLKKLGVLLFILGILDIFYLVFSIANQFTYFSAFNIFALIGGLFLFTSSFKILNILTFFAGFMGILSLGSFFVQFTHIPLHIWFAKLNLYPAMIINQALYIGFAALSFWLYYFLNSEKVLEIKKDQNLNIEISKFPLILSLGIFIIFLGLTSYSQDHESKQLAKNKIISESPKGTEVYVETLTKVSNQKDRRILVRAKVLSFNEGILKEHYLQWKLGQKP